MKSPGTNAGSGSISRLGPSSTIAGREFRRLACPTSDLEHAGPESEEGFLTGERFGMTAGRNANESSDLRRLVVGGLLFGADTARSGCATGTGNGDGWRRPFGFAQGKKAGALIASQSH